MSFLMFYEKCEFRFQIAFLHFERKKIPKENCWSQVEEL